MKNQVLANPFVVGRYVSDDFFCDRKQETDFLRKQIRNGRNVALISSRRMGKSGLVAHFFNQSDVSEEYYTFYVDIYATSSFSEFVYLLGKAIYEQLKPRKTVWAERFFQVISSLRVGFKIDSQTGDTVFDISLGDIHSPQTTLDQIFEYLENADRPCIVAIDEFQQIGSYTAERGADAHPLGANVEALLRTKIQQCRQTQFIFSGSKRHLMSNMFNSPAKPFYQSVIMMGLEPIPLDVYTDFAVRMFENRGKTVSPEAVRAVYRRFEGCTWFVQMMMNELFALTPVQGVCGTDLLAEASAHIIASQYMGYQEQMAHLPLKQKQLLIAIAKERQVSGITSAAFIKRNQLSSASSVQAALKSLLKEDVVVNDDGRYRIYDYFFAEWIAENY